MVRELRCFVVADPLVGGLDAHRVRDLGQDHYRLRQWPNKTELPCRQVKCQPPLPKKYKVSSMRYLRPAQQPDRFCCPRSVEATERLLHCAASCWFWHGLPTVPGFRPKVCLEGILVREPRPGWITLEVPALEVWEQPLRGLAREQRERIESPEFFKLLQDQIGRRYLAMKQPPGKPRLGL
jgi:hypothetical protein